jgi:hypothetical protein
MRIRIHNTGFCSVEDLQRFEADPDTDCHDKQESTGAIELRGLKIWPSGTATVNLLFFLQRRGVVRHPAEVAGGCPSVQPHGLGGR